MILLEQSSLLYREYKTLVFLVRTGSPVCHFVIWVSVNLSIPKIIIGLEIILELSGLIKGLWGVSQGSFRGLLRISQGALSLSGDSLWGLSGVSLGISSSPQGYVKSLSQVCSWVSQQFWAHTSRPDPKDVSQSCFNYSFLGTGRWKRNVPTAIINGVMILSPTCLI